MIPLASCKDAQLARSAVCLVIGRPGPKLAAIIGVCKHGASVSGLKTTTLLRVSSTAAVAYSWSADNSVLIAFDDCVILSAGR